jgi:hypothetical protein
MSKYDTFVRILDELRREAPRGSSRYYPPPSDLEKVNQARSRAFLHLFLKVKFGLLTFEERERYVTDGAGDGGIDAYYIDTASKTTYLVQSKFRTNAKNFSEKEISLTELLSMDVERITKGEECDENGVAYNGKIKQLQRDMFEVPDIGKYRDSVVVLANLGDKDRRNLKKWTGGFACEVYDFDRTYDDLVFPIVSGTFYDQDELRIQLNLSNNEPQSSRISYQVRAKVLECQISVLFVPTLEIAKALHTYKNSILQFNPRSYLELKRNTVNQKIRSTIVDVDTNEFALYNNGITMLSHATEFNDRVGKTNRAQLVILQPQIINGGQTAYTLSRIFEEQSGIGGVDKTFDGKEVLLKVITLPEGLENDAEKLALIEAVSRATNEQTPVEEADRRANDRIQVQMQEAIFKSFGYFYERKRGEYADGLHAGYINESLVINRGVFVRICKASDLVPSETKRSDKVLFSDRVFSETVKEVARHVEYFYGYRCYQRLGEIAKTMSSRGADLDGVATYGQVFRSAKYAAVAACRLFYGGEASIGIVDSIVDAVLADWKAFERHISKLPHNNLYFYRYYDESSSSWVREVNYANYYKGHTLDNDIKSYFDGQRAVIEKRFNKKKSVARNSKLQS